MQISLTPCSTGKAWVHEEMSIILQHAFSSKHLKTVLDLQIHIFKAGTSLLNKKYQKIMESYKLYKGDSVLFSVSKNPQSKKPSYLVMSG